MRKFLFFFVLFIEFCAHAKIDDKITKSNTYTIIIDPGHGGKDCGTSNKNIQEKNIALDYALALKKELKRYPKYKIILTRETDKTISLEERKNIANKAKADIYISLHTDYHTNKNVSGASVYTLSREAMVEESLSLASKKNKNKVLKNEKILKEHKEIASIIIDMVYQDTQNSSLKFAEITSTSLSQEINMLNKYKRVGGFKVLKGVDIPGVLIEIGYLSNDQDFNKLQDKIFKQIFIRSMVKAINSYFEK